MIFGPVIALGVIEEQLLGVLAFMLTVEVFQTSSEYFEVNEVG